MALDTISLSNFRNHGQTRLEGTAKLNLLYGENGAGKTNVLEAISLFAAGRGMRRAPIAEMAMTNGEDATSHFAISAALNTGDEQTDEPVILGTGTKPDRPKRRIVQINGAETSAVSLGEWVAIGWLTPAMDRLFADSAGARRRYMDRLTLALEPSHARNASRYEASLRERNRLLSAPETPDPAWLESIEIQLAQSGANLAQARARLIGALMQELAILPEEPFARPMLTYCPGGPLGEEELRAGWLAARSQDRHAGRTLTGPHRDELQVVMAGKQAPAAQCSTGEQKAMLIAITLAHSVLSARGRPSLLLLDEVAAHLDPIRRDALFERLNEGEAQVWLTGTEAEPFANMSEEAARWRVSDGAVERL